jgi:hypothetical protein
VLDFVRVEGSKTGKIGIWCRTRGHCVRGEKGMNVYERGT